MAVDDHGLEVLKKAGEEVNPGSKADYYIKVQDASTVTLLTQILAKLQELVDCQCGGVVEGLIDQGGNNLQDQNGNNLV